MSGFTRRSVLQTGGAFGIAVGLSSFAVAQRMIGEGGYLFFTSEEAAFIEAAVDHLIPPEPDWPGARDAGVPEYIDLQLAGPYGAGDRLFLGGPVKAGTPGQGYQLALTPAELYRRSMQSIAAQTPTGFSFAAASPNQQEEFLRRLETGEADLDGIPSAVFFETLLANTIEGYFADPAYGGNRDMAGWRMVGFPGVYAAYLGVYTQHGLAYAREPLSIADAQRQRGTDGHMAQGHQG